MHTRVYFRYITGFGIQKRDYWCSWWRVVFRYELHEKGLILTDDPKVVADVYSKNEALELQVQHFRDESEKFKVAAM